MQWQRIREEVVSRIKPSTVHDAAMRAEIAVFVKELNAALKRKRLAAKAFIGGSFAKDTWLDGDHDVDVFVRFAKKHPDEKLSDLLEGALRKWKPDRIHGSRDYFQALNHAKFEIVPVRDIKRPADALNVTDFSPWHVAWVNTRGKKLKDDIRVAKKFCKAHRVYGAESYIHGFSGHVIDILVIHYGGFLKLMKAAAKWKSKQVIDPSGKHKGNALLVLNASKTQGPLVLVDPVQPLRNAASAVNQENFDRFIAAAKAFRKPSLEMFEEKRVDFDALSRKGSLVRFDVVPIDAKEDVAGTKLVRVYEFIKEKLGMFSVKDAGWEWHKKGPATFWYLLENRSLSSTWDFPGPPVERGPHVAAFKKKHRKTFVKAGRVWAKVPQQYRTPAQLAKALTKDEFVLQRVTSLKVLR
ncbi:nucleotidyltransferase domain-containing protein [Candidatus Woesearchaeota archaeon]|nr:nucleotidyltransferase domain-containing protein [Candidatus Woesearchaeota archaeon]